MKLQTTDKYSVARKRMINDQIVGRGITDDRVIKVMGRLPRHHFVDDAFGEQAYKDRPLSIGEGQTISQPYIVALMTQALQLTGREKVLEIGTGCGYQTVILSQLTKQVHTIERIKTLGLEARMRFKKLGLRNIVLRIGDGSVGWPEAAPFDRIIMACAAPQMSKNLMRLLTMGGVLVMPVTSASGQQELIRVLRTKAGFKSENLGACHFVKLVGKLGYRE